MSLITDEEVAKLEEDQRRTKGTADRRRSEALSAIQYLRCVEAGLAEVRAYVEEWEDGVDGDDVLSILDDVREPPKREGPRPDRRKRRIMQLYDRLDIAEARARDILELAKSWGENDDDAKDIIAILGKAKRPM